MTIIELCVVMLLSAIVTGIAFTTLDIFQGSLRKFKKDSSAITDINLLHRLLYQDIWRSKEVLSIKNGVQTAGRTGVASYYFYPDYIIREKENQTDTFAFQNDKLMLTFQKQPLEIQGMLADKISFDLIHKKELHTFTFSKNYGADVLMLYDRNPTSNGWH